MAQWAGQLVGHNPTLGKSLVLSPPPLYIEASTLLFYLSIMVYGKYF